MNSALKERRRIQGLQSYELLDTDSEAAYDSFTHLAAAICGTPISLISLVDESRQWFKSNLGLEGVTQTARDVAFCAHAIESAHLMEVPDALADPRFRENPLVTEDPNIRFYAGVPLVVEGGFALGTLCVIDVVPRSLDETQRAQLRLLSAALVELIEARRHTIERNRANAELRRVSTTLEVTLATIADAVVRLDKRGKVQYLNLAAESLLHAEQSDLAGRPLDINVVDMTDGTPVGDLFTKVDARKRRALLSTPGAVPICVEYQASATYSASEELNGYVLTMRDVSADERLLQFLKRIAIEASSAQTLRDALTVGVEAITAYTGWPVGHAYVVSHDAAGGEALLVSSDIWHIDAPQEFAPFRAVSDAQTFRRGDGLIGYAWKHKSAVSTRDVHGETSFLRTDPDHHVGGAFAFPILADDEVVAVLEFFTPEIAEVDTDFLNFLETAGTLLGRVVERNEATARIQDSESPYRSVAESAADAIVSADSTGCIIAWNPAAERMFGWSAHEALGQPLTSLMPETYRERHKQAFSTFIESRAPHVLGRTIELEGLRKNGSTFALDLSLSAWEAGDRL